MTNTVTGAQDDRAHHANEFYLRTPACDRACPACAIRCAVITAIRADYRHRTVNAALSQAERADAFARFADADRSLRAERSRRIFNAKDAA